MVTIILSSVWQWVEGVGVCKAALKRIGCKFSQPNFLNQFKQTVMLFNETRWVPNRRISLLLHPLLQWQRFTCEIFNANGYCAALIGIKPSLCLIFSSHKNKNQNFGINRDTLLYVKQINNRQLLCIVGNCIQYRVIIYNGKESEEHYPYLNQFAVYLKHCN